MHHPYLASIIAPESTPTTCADNPKGRVFWRDQRDTCGPSTDFKHHRAFSPALEQATDTALHPTKWSAEIGVHVASTHRPAKKVHSFLASNTLGKRFQPANSVPKPANLLGPTRIGFTSGTPSATLKRQRRGFIKTVQEKRVGQACGTSERSREWWTYERGASRLITVAHLFHQSSTIPSSL